jgi:hypothetical protein
MLLCATAAFINLKSRMVPVSAAVLIAAQAVVFRKSRRVLRIEFC